MEGAGKYKKTLRNAGEYFAMAKTRKTQTSLSPFLVLRIQHDRIMFRNLLTFSVFLLGAVIGQSVSDGSRHGFSR